MQLYTFNLKLNNKINIVIPATFGPCDPSNVNNKCPATILAASRIDRVPGRITFLTVSIITITGINATGVPLGTK